MTHSPNPNDIFWLARYAHNTLAPLIKAAQQYEPTIRLSLQLRFGAPEGNEVLDHAIEAYAHWNRDGMFLMSDVIRDKAQLAHWAKRIQRFIDTEQAALEAAADEAFLKSLDGNVAGHAEYVEALNRAVTEAPAAA